MDPNAKTPSNTGAAMEKEIEEMYGGPCPDTDEEEDAEDDEA